MIKIYTKPDCPWCVKAKEVLNTHNIPFKEIVIGEDVTRSWVLEAFPQMRTVPIILDNNRMIGGYTNLVEELGTNKYLGNALILG